MNEVDRMAKELGHEADREEHERLAVGDGDLVSPDSVNAAPSEWAGLPTFVPEAPREHRIVITCETEEGRDELVAQLGLVIAKKTKGTWSAWWPPRDREDLASLRFDFDEDAA